MTENKYKRQHIPCINPDCGSSDALSEFLNGSAYCFSCDTKWSPSDYQKAKNGDEPFVPTFAPKSPVVKGDRRRDSLHRIKVFNSTYC